MNQTSNFKATALSDETLRTRAPSIFASGPMMGVSHRYAFVPTAEILTGLRDLHWVPVEVEEQRIRQEARRGFQKHLIRLRLEAQMETLDEWNVELVVVNSHDAGCAYQLHAGIYRRICSNGLVIGGESFNAIRFRHSGCLTGEVVQASLRLVEAMPKIGERIARFRERILEPRESLALAEAGAAAALSDRGRIADFPGDVAASAPTGGRGRQPLARGQPLPRGAPAWRSVGQPP